MRQTWIFGVNPAIFVFGHHKLIFFIRIHDIHALVSREKLFFAPFSLESKFSHQMKETWILAIISILIVIGPHKYVLLIWIHNFYALVSQEKLFFPPFSLEFKVHSSTRQTWILVLISILFGIGYHEHILLIQMHYIDALVS